MEAIYDAVTRWDLDVLLFIQDQLRMDMLTPFWKAITFLANGGWFWVLLSVILVLNKKSRRTGFMAMLSMAVGYLIVNLVLKNAVARIRPYEVEPALTLLVNKAHDFSFPSGHACVSFSCATSLFRSDKKMLGVPALILASLIAFSRLYVGIHYPTDVIFGILFGVLSSLIAWGLFAFIEKKMNERKRRMAA